MTSLLNETKVEVGSDFDERLFESIALNENDNLKYVLLDADKAEKLVIEFKKKRLAVATTIAQEEGKFMVRVKSLNS